MPFGRSHFDSSFATCLSAAAMYLPVPCEAEVAVAVADAFREEAKLATAREVLQNLAAEEAR